MFTIMQCYFDSKYLSVVHLFCGANIALTALSVSSKSWVNAKLSKPFWRSANLPKTTA